MLPPLSRRPILWRIASALWTLSAITLLITRAWAADTPQPPDSLAIDSYPTPTTIQIRWVDRSTNEDSFTVERKMEGEVDFAPIASVNFANGKDTTVTFADKDLPRDTQASYRVNAVNAAGASPYTAVVTTQTGPTAPTALTATTVAGADDQLQLTWTDTSKYETSFQVYRRNPGASTFTLIRYVDAKAGTGSSVSYTDTGLNKSSTYEYYVVASNSAGNSPESNHASATTNAATTVPATPSNLRINTYPTPTSMNVAFLDASTNEDSFVLERKAETESDFSTVQTFPAVFGTGTWLEHTSSGLAVDTAYSYRAKARNTVGDSPYTAVVTGYTVPVAASGLTVAPVPGTDNQLRLVWKDNSKYETTFRIYRRSPGDATFTLIRYGDPVSGTNNKVSYTDTNLKPNSSYEYYIVAANSAGDADASNRATGTTNPTNPPGAPSDLSAVPEGVRIQLRWLDTGTDESGFVVERKAEGETDFNVVATPGPQAGSNTYVYLTDDNLEADRAYTYRVKATNGAGDSAYSNQATAATVPLKPGELKAEPVNGTSDRIALTWKDNSRHEDGFILYRKKAGDTDFAKVGTAPGAAGTGSTVRFTDTGLSAQTAYTYRVTANNAAGESGATEEATATTNPDKPANQPPVAKDDLYGLKEDNTLTVSAASGVLSNDTDPENDTLTAVLVTRPTHGTLTLNANGGFTYRPDLNYNGSDQFTYKASDGKLSSAPATVTLTITPENDPPVAVNDTYRVNEDATLTASAPGVLGNDTDPDNDPLTVTLVQGPAHGTLDLKPDGSFTYKPKPDFPNSSSPGSDSFTYKVSDGKLASNIATAYITVDPVNDPPVAKDDTAVTRECTAVTIDLIGNDTDPDNDVLKVASVGQPAHGTVEILSRTSVRYMPDEHYTGKDAFTYMVKDAAGATATANVEVTINTVPPEQRYRLRIGASNPRTWTGNTSLFTVAIKNTGVCPQQITDIRAAGSDWLRRVSALPEKKLYSGEEAQVTFEIKVPANAPGGPLGAPALQPFAIAVEAEHSYNKTVDVEVYNQPITTIEVRVLDDRTGAPMPGAIVALDNTDKFFFTDGSGRAMVDAVLGSRTVFAFQQNYLPAMKNLDVAEGAANRVTLRLPPGKALEVKGVDVKQLTPEEIQQRGVDLQNPQNYFVYDFTVKMQVVDIPIKNVVLPKNPEPGEIVPIVEYGGNGGSGGGGGGGDGDGGDLMIIGEVYYPTTDPTQRIESWIVIPGSVRILKQFWEATVFIRNNSLLTIEDLNATLTVPRGLGLPDLKGKPQPVVQTLGTIAPNSEKQALWIVRGDAAGSYHLTGTATGNLVLGGARVPLVSTLNSGDFTVVMPKLNVSFDTPKSVKQGEIFTLGINVKNESSIDLLGSSVEIKADRVQNAHLADNEARIKEMGLIKIGQTKRVEFRFISEVTGFVNKVETYVSPDPAVQPDVTIEGVQVLANDDIANTLAGQPVTIPVLANDIYSASPFITAVTDGTNGAASTDGATVTYTPAAGFGGIDSFTYTLTDRSGALSTATVTVTVRNPAPSLTKLSATSAVAGSSGFTLTLNGSGFVRGSQAEWNGQRRATTYVSASELRALIPASDLATTGSAKITVSSPTPGGGRSNAQVFTITAPGGQPLQCAQAVLRRDGSEIVATVTVNNTGAIDVTHVRITDATLGAYTPKTALPLSLGTIKAKASATFTLRFPAGPRGSAVVLRINGKHDTGQFGVSQRHILP